VFAVDRLTTEFCTYGFDASKILPKISTGIFDARQVLQLKILARHCRSEQSVARMIHSFLRFAAKNI
jgi:hypothetical protein